MESKFTPIAKIKKQQRDKVEVKLAKARSQLRLFEDKMLQVDVQMQGLEQPLHGSMKQMRIFQEQLYVIRVQKEQLKEQIVLIKQRIENLKAAYKQAHMEFEKIKYLEQKEVEEWLQKLKKQEQLDMDEIASVLFSNMKR